MCAVSFFPVGANLALRLPGRIEDGETMRPSTLVFLFARKKNFYTITQ